jgi:antitoxin (DNA-binding transcriptional repressor) of toxin-antitoxin stability system
MIRLNIHEAKTHLSRYLARLERGEVIVLCRRNVPIAEIRPLSPARAGRRPLGLARSELAIPAAFFEPLPEDLLRGFDPRGGA